MSSIEKQSQHRSWMNVLTENLNPLVKMRTMLSPTYKEDLQKLSDIDAQIRESAIQNNPAMREIIHNMRMAYKSFNYPDTVYESWRLIQLANTIFKPAESLNNIAADSIAKFYQANTNISQEQVEEIQAGQKKIEEEKKLEAEKKRIEEEKKKNKTAAYNSDHELEALAASLSDLQYLPYWLKEKLPSFNEGSVLEKVYRNKMQVQKSAALQIKNVTEKLWRDLERVFSLMDAARASGKIENYIKVIQDFQKQLKNTTQQWQMVYKQHFDTLIPQFSGGVSQSNQPAPAQESVPAPKAIVEQKPDEQKHAEESKKTAPKEPVETAPVETPAKEQVKEPAPVEVPAPVAAPVEEPTAPVSQVAVEPESKTEQTTEPAKSEQVSVEPEPESKTEPVESIKDFGNIHYTKKKSEKDKDNMVMINDILSSHDKSKNEYNKLTNANKIKLITWLCNNNKVNVSDDLSMFSIDYPEDISSIIDVTVVEPEPKKTRTRTKKTTEPKKTETKPVEKKKTEKPSEVAPVEKAQPKSIAFKTAAAQSLKLQVVEALKQSIPGLKDYDTIALNCIRDDKVTIDNTIKRNPNEKVFKGLNIKIDISSLNVTTETKEEVQTPKEEVQTPKEKSVEVKKEEVKESPVAETAPVETAPVETKTPAETTPATEDSLIKAPENDIPEPENLEQRHIVTEENKRKLLNEFAEAKNLNITLLRNKYYNTHRLNVNGQPVKQSDLKKKLSKGVVLDFLTKPDDRYNENIKTSQKLLDSAMYLYKKGEIQKSLSYLIKASEFCDSVGLEDQSIKILNIAQKLVNNG